MTTGSCTIVCIFTQGKKQHSRINPFRRQERFLLKCGCNLWRGIKPVALINDGWVSLNNEYTVMPTGDYEMVVDIGGNTAVKIWTTLEDSVHAEWGKSIELIVQHEVDNVKHQLYFRVLLGGEEGRDI